MRREPFTPMIERDARRTIRGWCEDPALWVVVVDRSLCDWLRRIGLEVYQDTRPDWFQVMIVGPLLVSSMAKSEMSRADLAGRFRELGAELPEEDPDDPEVFQMATSFSEQHNLSLGEAFARWVFSLPSNQEDSAPRPKRIRRRCNPLRQRR